MIKMFKAGCMWQPLWTYFLDVLAVGLAMSDRMKDALVIASLQQALTHRHPGVGLLHHSDRGRSIHISRFCHYTPIHGLTCGAPFV